MPPFANLRHFIDFTSRSKKTYTELAPSPSRASSELYSPTSEDGLLEKLAPSPSRRSTLRRWSALIVGHIIVAALYGALLYYVVINERKQTLHGPGIVFSKTSSIQNF